MLFPYMYKYLPECLNGNYLNEYIYIYIYVYLRYMYVYVHISYSCMDPLTADDHGERDVLNTSHFYLVWPCFYLKRHAKVLAPYS